MKLTLMRVLIAFLLFSSSNSASVGGAENPVSRVVSLMQSLQAKLENDMKKEEDLYETYACWAKSVVSQKTLSNEKANSRIDELRVYIQDIKAGKVEFTTERTDLDNEMATIVSDIEVATAQRTAEKDEFEAAKAEMNQAITALDEAIDVLAKATKKSLLSVKSAVNEGFHDRVIEAQNLERAVQISRNYLSKGDARFLEHLLSGEVPVVDWKKLNRKATYKTKYKSRSGDIQKTLAELLATFKANLQAAEDKEKSAQNIFDELMKSKNAQKDKTAAALTDMEKENGARGLSEGEAEDEINFLDEQVKFDSKVISDTEKALAKKKAEFAERKALQQGELGAYSQAIEILHSDDARDLFKKSMTSQGYMLMQIKQHEALSALSERASAAVVAVREARRKSGDSRLTEILTRIAQGGRDFTKVIAAIDKMVGILESEGSSDTEFAKKCKEDYSKKSADIQTDAAEMDEKTELIRKKKAEIEDLEKQIEQGQEEIKQTESARAEATAIRNKQNAEWKQADLEDTQAAALVKKAQDVINTYYNKFSLMQQTRQPFKTEAGKAAPSAPETWSSPYTGAATEKGGIVGILATIHQDIEADKAAAKKAEDDAKSEYDAYMEQSQKAIEAIQGKIEGWTQEKAAATTAVSDANKNRVTLKGKIKAAMDFIKGESGACDFMNVNIEVRAENRKNEMNGLKKAKELLLAAHETKE